MSNARIVRAKCAVCRRSENRLDLVWRVCSTCLSDCNVCHDDVDLQDVAPLIRAASIARRTERARGRRELERAAYWGARVVRPARWVG